MRDPKVEDLLHGEYNFPDDCPELARVLSRAAFKISKGKGYKESTTSITSKSFQDWWKTPNENTRSSMCGIYFSHYKTAATNDLLSS